MSKLALLSDLFIKFASIINLIEIFSGYMKNIIKKAFLHIWQMHAFYSFFGSYNL